MRASVRSNYIYTIIDKLNGREMISSGNEIVAPMLVEALWSSTFQSSNRGEGCGLRTARGTARWSGEAFVRPGV